MTISNYLTDSEDTVFLDAAVMVVRVCVATTKARDRMLNFVAEIYPLRHQQRCSTTSFRPSIQGTSV